MAASTDENLLYGIELPRSYREALDSFALQADELRELGVLIWRRPAIDFAITMALILLTPVIYLSFPHPLTLIPCILLSLHVFGRLAQMVHGSDHGTLFPSESANRRFGNLCAYLMCYTRQGHRTAHLAHHSFLNTERDSDRVWGDPEDSVKQVLKKLMQDLLLISALKRLLQYSQTDRKTYEASPWRKMNLKFIAKGALVQLPIVPVQLGLLAYYWILIGPQFYLICYILPMLTLYPAIIRLRSTVEHSFPAGYKPESGADHYWVVRSTRANLLERFIVAPLDIPRHFEHHLLPGVPYYNLARARVLIESRAVKVPLARGYLGFMLEKWRQERGLPPVALSRN